MFTARAPSFTLTRYYPMGGWPWPSMDGYYSPLFYGGAHVMTIRRFTVEGKGDKALEISIIHISCEIKERLIPTKDRARLIFTNCASAFPWRIYLPPNVGGPGGLIRWILLTWL